jgi:hypothetical protein
MFTPSACESRDRIVLACGQKPGYQIFRVGIHILKDRYGAFLAPEGCLSVSLRGEEG